MDSRGYDGSWRPFPSQTAGLYRGAGWGSLFDDLRQLLQRSREDAPLTASGAE